MFLPGDGVAVTDVEEDVDVILVDLGGLFRELKLVLVGNDSDICYILYI